MRAPSSSPTLMSSKSGSTSKGTSLPASAISAVRAARGKRVCRQTSRCRPESCSPSRAASKRPRSVRSTSLVGSPLMRRSRLSTDSPCRAKTKRRSDPDIWEGLAKHSLCRRRRAARPEAASSVAPVSRFDTRAPCVLASERPSRPDDERRSTKPSLLPDGQRAVGDGATEPDLPIRPRDAVCARQIPDGVEVELPHDERWAAALRGIGLEDRVAEARDSPRDDEGAPHEDGLTRFGDERLLDGDRGVSRGAGVRAGAAGHDRDSEEGKEKESHAPSTARGG